MGAPTTLEDACRAYRQRMADGQIFSHLTAAELWGVPLPREWQPGDPIHVSTRAARRSPKCRGVVGHQLFDERVTARMRRGMPVTDPASTWCHLASTLSDEDLVAAGDHLVLTPIRQRAGDPRPYVPLEQLRKRAAVFGGHGALRARRAAARVREGAESRRESLLRLWMVADGLPEPELQAPILNRHGTEIARVDLYYPAWRVAVEYDGEQHRTSDRQYDRDMTRLTDLQHADVTVVRIRKQHMPAQGREAVHLIRRALHDVGAPAFARPM